MGTTRLGLVGLLTAVGCVKGNPAGVGDGTFVDSGGTLAIAGCGYSLTTPQGAEAPRVAVAALGADPTVRLVHLGLMGDPRTSVVVQWRTADETTLATTIRFAAGAGLAPAQLTQTQTGVEFGYRAGGSIYRMHQAHLCGLSPDTAYSYQVGASQGGVDHFSPVYTFHTAPDLSAKPEAAVEIAFVGDSRGGYDVWQQLVGQLVKRTPDLVLFSGDAVTFGITQPEWEEFFARAEPLFATVPVVAANGNHEGNAVNYYAQMALPGDQQNFGLDYGYAHITVGNDTPDDAGALTGAFKAALAADFEASRAARWKLFMHHQPMFSASTRHGPSETLQAAWLPLVDQYHIDLVLNGHDHDYEITYPLIGGARSAAANATVFVVAGGAGAELYPNGKQAWTQYSESSYTAAMIHVDKQALSLTPFHQDGTPLTDALASFAKSR
jgi:acid phosphatase type 7